MTLALRPHVTIGGVDFLLDESEDNHFVHALDAFANNGQGEVIGVQGVTKSKSTYWEITDWSGGQGYANWSPQHPWGYDWAYPGVGARQRGRLKQQDRLHNFSAPARPAGWPTKTTWNGREYTWDGDQLWEYDKFNGCTASNHNSYKQEKYWRKVFDRAEGAGQAKGLMVGPNMLIAWGEYSNRSYFIGHGGGFDSEIMVSRPIIEMPEEAKIYDVTYGNGSLWMLGNYGGYGWILEADLTSGQVVPRKKIDPEDGQPSVGNRICMIYGDIWVSPGYVYDIDYDAVHYVAGSSGTLYTGSYDFGYPFEEKLILGIYSKGNGNVTLRGDSHDFTATNVANFVKVDPPISTRRLEMELTPRIDYVAVEAIVVPNSNRGSGVNEYWYLKLRLKDESEGTEMTTSGGALIPGDTLREQLWNAINNNDVLDFENHYASPHETTQVILDSLQDSVIRSDYQRQTVADGAGEGTATIILRKLNA